MDDDDKVRRNLIVLSALIAAYFWLGLPPATVSNRILGTEQVQVDPLKIWSAILVLLVYQLYRYWTTAQPSDTWRDARTLWRSFVAEGLRKVVETSARVDESKGRPYRLLQRDEDVPKDRFSHSGPLYQAQKGTAMDGWWSGPSEDPWTQLATTGRIGTSGSLHVSAWRINMPRHLRWWYELHLALPRFSTTPYLAEFGAPFLLGYVALCLCLGRLVSELA